MKTKYEIGQMLWMMYDNKVKEIEVSKIDANWFVNKPFGNIVSEIKYKSSDHLDINRYYLPVNEYELFESKEELMKSL